MSEEQGKKPNPKPRRRAVPWVGMQVQWGPDPDTLEKNPVTGWITQLGHHDRHTVHVVHVESQTFDRKDGVPYIEDVRRPEDLFDGCWDYTPRDK